MRSRVAPLREVVSGEWGKARNRYLRDAEGLSEGLSGLAALEEEFGGTSLGGPLLVAENLIRRALEESRSWGCHFRLDDERSLSDAGGCIRVGR